MTTSWKSSAWVNVSQEPGTLILRLCGELDITSCDVIKPAVMAAIPSAYTVILDLGDLTFCDSSGIAMFIAAHENAKAHGAVLAVRGIRPPVRRVFEIAHLDDLIELIE